MALSRKTTAAVLILGGALIAYNVPGCASWTYDRAREIHSGVREGILGYPSRTRDYQDPSPRYEVRSFGTDGIPYETHSTAIEADNPSPSEKAGKSLALILAAGAIIKLGSSMANSSTQEQRR